LKFVTSAQIGTASSLTYDWRTEYTSFYLWGLVVSVKTVACKFLAYSSQQRVRNLVKMELLGDDRQFIESRKCLSLKAKNRWSCNRSLEQSYEDVEVWGVCDSNDDLNHHRSEDPLPRHYSIKRLTYATSLWGCSQCRLFSYRQKYKNHRAHSFLRPTDYPKLLIAWLNPTVPTFLVLNFLNS
jgi:hypothetical protein